MSDSLIIEYLLRKKALEPLFKGSNDHRDRPAEVASLINDIEDTKYIEDTKDIEDEDINFLDDHEPGKLSQYFASLSTEEKLETHGTISALLKQANELESKGQERLARFLDKSIRQILSEVKKNHHKKEQTCERCDAKLVPYDDKDNGNCDSADCDLCDHCKEEGHVGSSEADAIYERIKEEGK